MFSFIQGVIAFIVVLAPLVFIHELGHFLAAKLFRIGVPVFSLGFGPRVFGFRRRETDYRVSAIPLGGYVRMTGDESDEHRTGAPEEFLTRPRWQRFIVFVAGAAFNIALAFLALWLFFGLYGKESKEGYALVADVAHGSPAEVAGLQAGDSVRFLAGVDVNDPDVLWDTLLNEVLLRPDSTVMVGIDRRGERIDVEMGTGNDPKQGSGDPGWILVREGTGPPTIHRVMDDGPALGAGFEAGDIIAGADGKEPMTRAEFNYLVKHSSGKSVEVLVDREGGRVNLTVVPEFNEEVGGGRIGIEYRRQPVPRIELSFAASARESLRANVQLSKTLFVVLKRLVTAKLSLRAMSGPIGIAQHARDALEIGPDALLYMLGFFSLQLGILNLLPIPVLDGGHILLLGIESIMRRELSDRLKERFMQAGLVFLLAFMAVILYLDVVKTF